MAEKLITSRVKQRFDTLTEWQKVWETFTPLKGEVCKIQIPANTAVTGLRTSSSVRVMTKTGDGETLLKNLPWDSAIGADETQLSKGTDATASATLTHGGTFTAVTDTTVSGHKITDKTTTYTLPAETAINTEQLTGTKKTPKHSETFNVVTAVSKGTNSHELDVTTTAIQLPAETAITVDTLEKETDTLTHGGKFTALTSAAAGGAQNVDVTPTEFTLPAETNVAISQVTSAESTLTHGGAVSVVTSVQQGAGSHDISITTKKITLPTETTLKKGTDTSGTASTLTHGGKFNAVTNTSVSGHTVTDTITEFTLPSETPLTVTSAVQEVGLTPTHGETITLVTNATKGTGSHKLNVNRAQLTFPDETQLNKGDDVTGTAKTLSHGGTFTAVTDTAVSNHTITETVTEFTLPAETPLTKGTDVATATTPTSLSHGGTFTVMTDTDVEGHVITDKNTTFKLPSETDITVDILSANTQTLSHGDTFTVFTGAKKGGSSHNIDITPTTFTLPAMPTGAMIFKGTLGTGGTATALPTSPVAGWSYKVITAGTYASQACTVGDMLVYDGSAWVLIPSGDDEKKGTVTNVATGQGLSGGPITSTGTIKHADVTRTDTPSTATGSHGGTITVVDGITTDTMGHVTGANIKTVTLPSETSVGVTATTGSQLTPAHAGTVDVVTKVEKGSGSHEVKVTTQKIKLPSETSVKKGTDVTAAVTLTHGGTFVATTGSSASGHTITDTKTTYTLPAETTLTKGTDATLSKTLEFGKTFTAITDTGVNDHTITDTTTTFTMPTETGIVIDKLTALTKTLTHGDTFTVLTEAKKGGTSHNIDVTPTVFTMPAETEVSIDQLTATTSAPKHGESVTVVSGVTRSADDSHNIDVAKTTITFPSETTLSKGTDATAGTQTLAHGGTFTAITDIGVSGHTITDKPTTFTLPSETTLSVTDSESGNAVTDVTVSGHAITLKRGKTFLTAHPTISVGTDSTSTQTATHGGTFTAVDSVTRDANGHVTKINTKTVTLPSDAKVTQTPTSSDASYPLLLAPSNQTTATTTTSYFDSGVTLNPSKNTITSNITGSAKSLSPTEFYPTEGSTGYIKFATLSYSSWKQFNAVFLLQNQYSSEYSSSIVKICGSYGNTSISRCDFEIISGDDVSNKLYYYKDGESYTFYVKKNDYSHWYFTLLSNVKNSIVFDGYSTLLTTATTTGTATYNVSASKLTTKKTIALSGGATGTATSFDGTTNISIPVTSIRESYLQWGGKNFAGSWGPIDAAMVPNFAANRLAFLPATAVTLEYSTNSGSTWTTLNNDTIGGGLFSTGSTFPLGNTTTTKVDKSAYMNRVTITTTGFIYSALNKFAIRISTNGSSGCHCKIERRTKANQDAGTDTWETSCERAELEGWSGWNIINVSPIITHGNRTDQYSQIRFTFGVDTHASTSSYSGLQILRIMAFGGEGWTTCSNMAKDGHLYSYDGSQNATFPAGLNTVGQLKENGTRVSKVGHTHSVTAAGTTASTSITPAGSVSQPTFTGTEAGHTHTFTGTAANHNHTFTGTAHDHSFTGSAVTSGGASATISINSVKSVGTAASHSYTAPSLTATCANQCLTLTWSAGSHSFTANTVPTVEAKTVATAHTHSVTAAGTVGSKTAGGTVANASVTPAGTIAETKITPAGTVSKPTFTGTAASHNHTFTGTAVTSGGSSN